MENELSHWWLDLHPFLVRIIQGEAFELFVIGSALPLLVFGGQRGRIGVAAMQTQSTKSLRPAQAAEFLGISHATLWRWLKERPDFPRPRKIGARTTVWIVAELEQWRDAQAHK